MSHSDDKVSLDMRGWISYPSYGTVIMNANTLTHTTKTTITYSGYFNSYEEAMEAGLNFMKGQDSKNLEFTVEFNEWEDKFFVHVTLTNEIDHNPS